MTLRPIFLKPIKIIITFLITYTITIQIIIPEGGKGREQCGRFGQTRTRLETVLVVAPHVACTGHQEGDF